MTRHTRNKQMDKLTEGLWSGMKNLPIERMREDYKEDGLELDATFKWHRNFEGWGDILGIKSKTYNMIEFGGNEDTYGTHFAAKTKGW
ncbi:hypothetical protein TROLL_29 [Bacillus phage Troll]|uniref:Uncharacterized protein n=6 Tax=Caudoviricetes TaxID=2731619 RepID=A0A7U3T8I9_9CAUD|nr:hypothetical protein TROLL_29 [Bacillus phage Troll]YP_009055790.1 hypothetical protein LD11_gp025 [Bacillus phage Riley]AGM61382.1 hypothetical protein BTP1_8 [Bacillus phage phiBTP1]AMW61650.1 hypothetical protein JUGLONE_25 [Bacillus phage Juglone]ASZ75759.1 hypothetical protein TAFFO16_26 [Bacillus phage Taffo16]QPY77262.1 hypothetical protein ANTHOS_25 [Bacillus phage Anthos]ULF48647.1 hypothetical protein [Bacillus phage BillyBob]